MKVLSLTKSQLSDLNHFGGTTIKDNNQNVSVIVYG